MKLVKNENQKNLDTVSDKEAEEAFVKILKWIGEDPSREGLLETPKRVTKAFREYFKGYKEDPKEILSKTFGTLLMFKIFSHSIFESLPTMLFPNMSKTKRSVFIKPVGLTIIFFEFSLPKVGPI